MSNTSDYRILVSITKDNKEYPVTPSDFKLHFGAIGANDFEEYNSYLTRQLRAVTTEAEAFLQKDIALTTREYTMYNYFGDEINIPEGNYHSLVSILDSNDASVNYNEVFPYENKITITLSQYVTSDPLKVTVKTGYERENCPDHIWQAIMMRAYDYFMVHRGSQSTLSLQDTKAFERLLQNDKATF